MIMYTIRIVYLNVKKRSRMLNLIVSIESRLSFHASSRCFIGSWQKEDMAITFTVLIEKWSASAAAERANKDAFLIDVCDALGVPRPNPSTGDPDQDTYAFERDAQLINEGAKISVSHMDLYKEGCFILEAKLGSETGSKKLGTARRGTQGWNIASNDAYPSSFFPF